MSNKGRFPYEWSSAPWRGRGRRQWCVWRGACEPACGALARYGQEELQDQGAVCQGCSPWPQPQALYAACADGPGQWAEPALVPSMSEGMLVRCILPLWCTKVLFHYPQAPRTRSNSAQSLPRCNALGTPRGRACYPPHHTGCAVGLSRPIRRCYSAVQSLTCV